MENTSTLTVFKVRMSICWMVQAMARIPDKKHCPISRCLGRTVLAQHLLCLPNTSYAFSPFLFPLQILFSFLVHVFLFSQMNCRPDLIWSLLCQFSMWNLYCDNWKKRSIENNWQKIETSQWTICIIVFEHQFVVCKEDSLLVFVFLHLIICLCCVL